MSEPLRLLCSVLLTAMVTIMTPLSLPTDIQQQTIYTVVSKPVRRLELIWGRMIGYMALVTFLVAIFGVISLIYLRNTVGTAIRTTESLAIRAKKENRLTEAKLLTEQADQLRTRMQARVPVRGSLSFHRLARHTACHGHRRRLRPKHEGAAEPHRGCDSVRGNLELRRRAGSLLAAGPATDPARSSHSRERLPQAQHHRMVSRPCAPA